MRKKSNILFLAFIMLLLSVSVLPGQETKVNIAVLDLEPTGISNPNAEFLSNRLRTELFETGEFQVIEREKMNEILTEQGFQQSGCTSVECAIEIGQLLNVAVMTAGNIGKIDDLYSISVRMIDVKTGAIIKTATRDFEGKLSEVLTDIIPDIASELASFEAGKSITTDNNPDNEQKKDPQSNQKKESFRRIGVLLLGGFSTLTYTNDGNEKIDELNAYIAPDIDELPGHYLLGMEFRYAISRRWRLKLGFVAENQFSPWQASLTNYTPDNNTQDNFQTLQVERKNRFINTYIGVNYAIWNSPDHYDLYVGFDIGNTTYTSEIIYSYLLSDDTEKSGDNSYEYTGVTWKLVVGGTYFVSKAVSLGMSILFKNIKPFDTSDQHISSDFPDELKPVFLPEEINATGIQFTFYLGYHF